MSIKRYTGAAFAEVATRKRYSGSGWLDLTVGKRWNGAAWVDLWSDSSSGGGASGGSSGEGNLFSDLKSTVSSPTVHYSCGFETTASGVRLTFRGWLTSSASHLGTGILLTVYARMNGGAWSSAVIKQSHTVWNDATKHAAPVITLNGEASGRTKIEFYITRAGSSYGGSAGRIASAKSPKKYYFNP